MKKLILSLFIFCSVFAFSDGTIPIPQIIGLPAALASKVDKVTSKSLVADTSIVKLTGIQTGAQVNKLEGVQKNGVDLTITGKKVNITVPTTAGDIGAQPAGTYSTDIHGNITALNSVSGTNTGDETLTSIKTKLGAASSSNAGYLTNADWTRFDGKQNALGFTPYNATNPSGYISGITTGMVTTALGYTPLPTRTFGTAANNNTGDFYATGSTVVNSSSWGTNLLGGASSAAPNYLFGAYSGGNAYYADKTAVNAFVNSGLSANTIPKWNGISFIDGSIRDNSFWGIINLVGTGLSYDWAVLHKDATGIIRIPKDTYNVEIPSETTSSSPTTGALVVGGGIGVGGDIVSGGIIKAGNLWMSNDANYCYLQSYNSKPLKINDQGNSTFINGTSGGNVNIGYTSDQGIKLAVNGGAYFSSGITTGGNLTASGDLHCGNIYATSSNSNFISSDLSLGFGSYQGYKFAVNGTGLFSGKLRVTDVTDATIDPTPDGSIVTSGGIAAAKRIQAGIEIFSKGDVIADGDVYAGGELNAPIVRSSSIINPTGTSAQLLVADGSLLNISAVGGSVNQTQTTINGTIGGLVVCSMPFQTGTYKKVVIRVAALAGSITYSFPTAFSFTPQYYTGSAGLPNTTVNVTTGGVSLGSSSTTSGWITLEGY